MFNFVESVNQLRSIEDLSKKDSLIKRINPLTKLIVTIIYIMIVVSMNKYEITSLYPFMFYQIFLLYFCDVPLKLFFNMILIGLPLVLGIGVFNIFFNREVYLSLGIISITYGMISFVSLFIKGCLTITAGVLLICTTHVEDLAKSLRKIYVPKIITNQIVFMYRYIFVLIESVYQVNNAYMLRAPDQKGINIKLWGPLLGQILLRSFDKAEKIYNAMLLRGFDGEYITYMDKKLGLLDFCYLVSWCLLFILIKNVNMPLLIGNIVIGRWI